MKQIQEDKIISEFLKSLGPWREFVVIGGGFALFIYKLYLADPKLENLPVGTRDIDSLIPRRVPEISKKNIAKYLNEAGFIHVFKDVDIPATESFVKEIDGGEVEIEFLTDSATRDDKNKNVVIAGSFRRKKETVGDLDILVISKENGKVMDFFVSMPEVQSVIGKGKTKSSVKLSSGINVDLRVVEEKSYGAALNYFTGSKDHNVALRRIAIEKGCKLSEYGLFRNEKMIAGKTEEELYKALGLPYIEPELREMAGELEAARKGILPHLVGYNDLKGDLQVQTSWTDGNHSIEEMARAAQKINLQYIAITDHTKYLAFTGGLNEKKVLRQMAEIDAINEKLKKEGLKFTILKGTECDIHKDGSLDLQDSTLERLDVVGASVHSYFKLPRSEQTERLKKAMQNPHVDIMFHPTGREIQKREPIDLDMDDIIKTAKDTRTALEINAFPDRLDLKDEHIKMAIKAGVKLCINSDAHHTSHFRFLEFGIAQARRGWAEKKDIINTLPLRDFQKALK